MVHRLLGNLRIRLLLLILFILFPAFGLIGYTMSREVEQERAHAQFDAMRAVKVAAGVDAGLFETTKQLLLVLSHLPEVKNRDAVACAGLFSTLREKFPSYLALGVANPKGDIFCASIPGRKPANIGGTRFFAEAVAKRTFAVSPYIIGPMSGEPTVVLACPALDTDGEVSAVVLAALDLGWLNRLSHGAELPEGADFTIFDSQGTVLARYPDSERYVGKKADEAPIVGTILRTKTGNVEAAGLDGVQRLYAFMPLSETVSGSAYVSVGLPVDLAYQEAGEVLPRGLIPIVALVLLLGAGFLGDVLILRRVNVLKNTAKSLASGDMNARTGVTSRAEDIGGLMLAFDEMADALSRQQELLRRSEEKYRLLVEQIPAAAYTAVLDSECGTSYISPRVEQILGYAQAEWLANPKLWTESISSEDRSRVGAAIEKMRMTGEPLVCEYRLRHKNGNSIWVRDEAVVLNDEKDGSPCLHGILVDITERKSSEQALASLNRTLLTLSGCNQALVHAESEQELLDSICGLLVETGGYQSARVGFAGKDASDAVLLDVRAACGEDAERFCGSIRCGEPAASALRTGEIALRRAGEGPATELDALAGYGAAVSLPLLRGDTAFGCLIIHAADPRAFKTEELKLLRELAEDLGYGILALRTRTDRDRAEKEAGRADAEMRQIFETAADGMCVVDRNLNVLRVNETFVDLFGIGKEEAIGRKCHDLAGSRKCFTEDCTLKKILGGQSRVECEDERVAPDGRTLPCIVTATPLGATGEGAEGIVLNFKDTSAIKDTRMALRKSMESLRNAVEGTIGAMAYIVESRDPYTSGHQKRVSDIACAIAEELGLSAEALQGIRMAGLIHDIGKIAVPAELLSKPGKINEHEFALIRSHVQTGFDILRTIEFPWPVAEVAFQHHERIDGTGYPRNLRGEEILIEARIIAIADVVEAMASHRPYRAALGMRVAIAEIQRGKGAAYDAVVADACIKLASE
ncbi:MAG: PAS domain S-box protein, partial [Desulfobacteraceae bacterium]|nr:PAS domain S-box protein [Desulfobacteraceae bacterium]